MAMHSQICKVWCAVCGNNITTVAKDHRMAPVRKDGLDWGTSADGLVPLLKLHHDVVFIVIANKGEHHGNH